MAQTQAMVLTPCFSCTWRRALPLGRPPRMRMSMISSVFRPLPPAQQKVCSRMVFSGMSWNWSTTLFSTYLGSSNMPMPRAGLQESW